jgi:branched-subunit amino acid aminotransferase/4-amino-4-deoxychorismate lyase
MTDPQLIVWQNGRKIPWSEASVPVWDLGVVAGAAVSEMARTYRHQLFRMENHLARLVTSCRELGFSLLYSESDLAQAATEVIEANTKSLADASDLGIVWFVTAGANPTYVADVAMLESTVCVHTYELPLQQWQPTIRFGVQLTIPEQRQLSQGSFPVQHKTRNRLHWWLADRAAAEIRPGSRALLLDDAGHITETSSACFYVVVNDSVLTAKRGVLRSTTCDFVEQLCGRIGLGFHRTDLSAECIDDFQEAFLSSTPCGLLPVASIDNHRLPGPSGVIVQRLQAEWTRVTGVDTFEQILRS